MQQFYRFWANFVSKYSIIIIVLCFIITIVSTLKVIKTKYVNFNIIYNIKIKKYIIFYFRRKNNIRGYTPYGSRSLYEFDVRDEFFDQNGTGIRFIVLLLPKNSSNLHNNNIDEQRNLLTNAYNDNTYESMNGNMLNMDTLNEVLEAIFLIYFFAYKLLIKKN